MRCVLGYFWPSLERRREIGRWFRVVVLVGIKGDTRDICTHEIFVGLVPQEERLSV